MRKCAIKMALRREIIQLARARAVELERERRGEERRSLSYGLQGMHAVFKTHRSSITAEVSTCMSIYHLYTTRIAHV
jgi:hypothetical protein